VFRSVLGEAAIVGLISSLIGVGLGVLTAIGLKALLRGFGVDLPSGPLIIEPRTVIVGIIVGVGVTVIAAISPARRAVRIAPIAALSTAPASADASLRRRLIVGSVVTVLGALALGVGLSKPKIALVGLGAAALFIGITVLAPALARPLASAIGRPLARLLGVSGRLGRENSMRSPRRTAQTASALMIGLALVSAMAVFGGSAKASATSSVDNAVRADLIISSSSSNSAGTISTRIPALAAAAPGVTASATVYGGQFEVRSSLDTLRALSTDGLAKTVIVQLTSGRLSALSAGDLLIDTTTAKSDHLSVGDRVPVAFALTGRSTMRVGGIYKPNALITSYLVSDTFYRSHFQDPQPGAVLLNGMNPVQLERTVKAALAAYPNVQVQSRAEFEKAQISQVNQLLGLIYALLALAILIALIGIVNTLMLSVFERTREIGLLRAVGMGRRQVRSMVRSESVILALFGAVIGIVIGTGLGIALVAALRNQGIVSTSVPVVTLIVLLVLAGLLGLLAASWPARRAARLDILSAIATE
jgi:putative ABC transport system permease protein